jgi:hypothetical protein
VTVDKVLDLRRGLPGATGPATTVYSVQQRGDPNFGVDPTRSAAQITGVSDPYSFDTDPDPVFEAEYRCGSESRVFMNKNWKKI